MGFFDGIASGVISGIISPITNTITAIFTKKMDTDLEKYKVDGQVNVGLMQEDTKRLQAQKDLNLVLSQYSTDRIMRYGFIVPVIVWWTAYFWDSAFREILPSFTWRVLTPEPAVWTFVTWIFGFIFLHSTITNVFKKT